MKIKDTRIAEKLPENQLSGEHGMYTTHNEELMLEHWDDGFDTAKKRLLNTDLDPNDVCEVDVEKVARIIIEEEMSGCTVNQMELSSGYKKWIAGLAEAIAKAGCIKFKEKL